MEPPKLVIFLEKPWKMRGDLVDLVSWMEEKLWINEILTVLQTRNCKTSKLGMSRGDKMNICDLGCFSDEVLPHASVNLD